MKKIFFILLAVLSLAVSCKKIDFVVGDDPFTIEVKHVYSKYVWVDIIPENNDFYYYFDVVSVEEFNKSASDAVFIRSTEEMNHRIYDFLVEGEVVSGTYEQTMLYRDAVLEPYYGNGTLIEPETDYYLFAYAFDVNGQAIEKLHKIPFRTPAEYVSDITFEVSMEGDIITVVPSNDDQYLFDFATEKELETSYYGLPTYYFEQMIDVYEQYGFIDSMVSRGVDYDNIFDYYDKVDDGEKIYVMVSGYDHGVTSDIFLFELVYHAVE